MKEFNSSTQRDEAYKKGYKEKIKGYKERILIRMDIHIRTAINKHNLMNIGHNH